MCSVYLYLDLYDVLIFTIFLYFFIINFSEYILFFCVYPLLIYIV